MLRTRASNAHEAHVNSAIITTSCQDVFSRLMSTKDPGSRRSLIYIATIHKDGTQFSGYYSDSSHHDVNGERKTTYEPQKI